MDKNIVEGIIKVDPSKPPYSGRISVYKGEVRLGVIDPIKPDNLKVLEESEGKKITFRPELIERRHSETKFYISKFSLS